jgi:hypothetical protein
MRGSIDVVVQRAVQYYEQRRSQSWDESVSVPVRTISIATNATIQYDKAISVKLASCDDVWCEDASPSAAHF